ncbi:MAG TPA: ankyrin repeat domain-containing protein [Terriglobia bacterium]|nr:ankyrin repeat domain-containing protein [Terriglobia bacterium]
MERPTPPDRDLTAALFAHDFETAARLLAHGADVNRRIDTTVPDDRGIYDDTTTYLIEAAVRGDVEVARFLLKNGANPNIATSFANQTPLLAATQQGHSEVVDLLLSHGANYSAVDHPSKFSALEYAIADENADIVRSLLAAGARPVFRRLAFGREGGGPAREIVRLLVKHGFDINRKDDWGKTPLMWAAERAPLETVQFLIESGADVNIASGKNMNGVSSNQTALQIAKQAKRSDVIALLLRHGARVIAR